MANRHIPLSKVLQRLPKHPVSVYYEDGEDIVDDDGLRQPQLASLKTEGIITPISMRDRVFSTDGGTFNDLNRIQFFTVETLPVRNLNYEMNGDTIYTVVQSHKHYEGITTVIVAIKNAPTDEDELIISLESRDQIRRVEFRDVFEAI